MNISGMELGRDESIDRYSAGESRYEGEPSFKPSARPVGFGAGPRRDLGLPGQEPAKGEALDEARRQEIAEAAGRLWDGRAVEDFLRQHPAERPKPQS